VLLVIRVLRGTIPALPEELSQVRRSILKGSDDGV
jgi:hypothetical protein